MERRYTILDAGWLYAQRYDCYRRGDYLFMPQSPCLYDFARVRGKVMHRDTHEQAARYQDVVHYFCRLL